MRKPGLLAFVVAAALTIPPAVPAADDGPPGLGRMLRSYVEGRYFTALRDAARLGDDEWLRDDRHLLSGLAAARAGLHDRAAADLGAVLRERPVSPYYPVALAGWIESELDRGDVEEAARVAAEHLAGFWGAPRADAEAAIQATFLVSGTVSGVAKPELLDLAPDRPQVFPPRDSPIDRALYVAGQALLAAGRHREAARCLEAIMPGSAYFPWARYALGQAEYALGEHRRAERAFRWVRRSTDQRGSERFLRDRSALLHARLLHELGHESLALAHLAEVSGSGPFAIHAALLAAELSHHRPALALAYLASPFERGEPKLRALAARLDARLRLDVSDGGGAVSRLEAAADFLERYAAGLEGFDGRRLRSARRALETAERDSRIAEQGRRENLAAAMHRLFPGSEPPPRVVRWMTSWIERAGVRLPGLFPPAVADPFTAVAVAEPRAPEPPDEPAFPIVVRAAQEAPLREALRARNDLREAIAGGDAYHLRRLVRNRERRLAELWPQGAAAGAGCGSASTLRALWGRFADEVLRKAAAGERSRIETLALDLRRELAGALLVAAAGGAAEPVVVASSKTSDRRSDRRAPSPPR